MKIEILKVDLNATEKEEIPEALTEIALEIALQAKPAEKESDDKNLKFSFADNYPQGSIFEGLSKREVDELLSLIDLEPLCQWVINHLRQHRVECQKPPEEV